MNRTTQPGITFLLARLSNAALVGLIAGVIAALFDTVEAAFHLNNPFETALLLLQATSRLGLAGGALGLLASLFAAIGETLGERLGHKGSPGPATALAAAALPGIIYVSVRLFQGGFMSRLPARFVLVAVTALVLAIAFFLGARLGLGLLDRADGKKMTRASTLIIGGILVLIAIGLRYLDALLYRRLYLYLHGALGVATVGGLALGIRLTALRWPANLRRLRLAFVAVGVTVLLFVAARLLFDLRQTVKTASFEHTTTLANLLRSSTPTSAAPKHGRVSDEIQRITAERAMLAQKASSSNWPEFPLAHVLLVTVDALRADRLGIYGNEEQQLSPNLDKWASEKAVVFERAYCTAPHSSYSITSLHTSRFTHDEAMLGKEITHPTIADILKGRGYTSQAFYTKGIFFTEGDKVGHYRRSDFGFDKATHGAPPPDKLTDMAISIIDQTVDKGEPPLFLWVHYFNVHEPYRSTRFGTSPAERYNSEIFETDVEVIRLLEHAEKTLSGQLVTIFSADHGEEFNDHGGYYHGSTLYEEQVRIPLIVRVPDGQPGRVSTPVSTLGLAHTLLRLVGVTPPATMIGQDLRPAIFGGDKAHVAEPVFSAVMHHHMVVKWPFKLIADPSRKLYRLFNLQSDPKERFNLYDHKRAKADELLQEIQGWLDNLFTGKNEVQNALNLGHIRDLRAVPALVRLAVNTSVSKRERIEAIHLLGNLRDYASVPSLKALLDDKDEQVATWAALVLGDLGDASGQDIMHDALFDMDPVIRDKAAVSLARIEDKAATPALIETLGRNDTKMRERAIRMLGRLGDPRAEEPLIDMLEEDRARYLVVLALGKLGGKKSFDAIVNVLENDSHTDTRGYAVVALGWLERKEAIPLLIRVLIEQPEIKWTPESLVRLGAVGQAPVFGTDAARAKKTLNKGFGRCEEKPKILHESFMDRTFCSTLGPTAELGFFANAPNGATVIIRARHKLEGKGKTATLTIRVKGEEIGQVTLTADFQEFRFPTPAGIWHPGQHKVLLQQDKKGAFELDHLLVVEDQ